MPIPSSPSRTTSGFSFSMVRRALFEAVADRKFGPVEKSTVLGIFGPECVYCGAPIKRWDHLFAIFSGGDTLLGNMVPACQKCDDSKRHLPYRIWALSNAPNSPQMRGIADIERRLARIDEYAAQHAYQPRIPQERLTPDEYRRFEQLLKEAAALQQRFDSFASGMRSRGGIKLTGREISATSCPSL